MSGSRASSGTNTCALLALVCALAAGCPVAEPPCGGAARCAAGEPIPTGTVPNDVRLSRCGATEVAVVPASFDARVDAIGFDAEVLGSVFVGVSSAPWAVAGEADDLVLTLNGASAVAHVDVCSGTERTRKVISEVLEVTPALPLRNPRDVDGDGLTDTVVTQMIPRAPQAVVTDGADVWVAYTNLLEPSLESGQPPLFGPGFVARLDKDDNLAVVASRVLPCTNPQGLLERGDVLWVSCSGPLGPDESGAQGAVGDGALLALDSESLALLHTIDMGRFAPATPAALGDLLIVGSLVTPRVAILPKDALSLADATLITLPGADVDSVFEIATRGARALAPVFSLDALFAFDPAAPPASIAEDAGMSVRPGGTATRGLLALDLREGFSVAGLVLLGLSAEVVPLADLETP